VNIKQQIEHAAARAFFASAWADQAEETGHSGIFSGADIMQVMPDEIDPAALHAARTLVMDTERANPCADGIAGLWRIVSELPRDGADRECTPELFGHYLAMQAMGTGVGLESFGYAAREHVRVPYLEFGSYSLERDYFEQRAEQL
jgi:hypothetical protein